MKSVLISIQPKWCELIARGEKTIEVRKTAPKIDMPFKCYIYCTKGSKWHGCYDYDNNIFGLIHTKNLASADKYNLEICDGKVIGEFICDKIYDMRDVLIEPTCLTIEEWCKYTDNHKGIVYGWHISVLKIYDKPKELSNFKKYQMTKFGGRTTETVKRPPQSWMYVEEEE